MPAVLARPDGARAMVGGARCGRGKDHPFLSGFARALADLGVASLRFDFPYLSAGRRFPLIVRRSPSRRGVLVADAARAHAGEGEPVWASGKSFGGRMASMAVADGMDVAGLVFLGYPLHPPGKPEKARGRALRGALRRAHAVPPGEERPFAMPNEQLDDLVRRIGPSAVLDWIEDANHSFEVKGAKRPAREVGASLARARSRRRLEER